MKRVASLVALLLAGLFTAGSCLGYQEANFDDIEGRKVHLRWQQVKDKGDQMIELFGEVNGGDQCRQLNVKVYLSNSKDGSHLSRLIGHIKDYTPDAYNRFSAKDVVYSDKKMEKYWIVDDIFLDCLN